MDERCDSFRSELDATLPGREGKFFFSGEKKQKTFILRGSAKVPAMAWNSEPARK
jgi:hypothetical protein